MRQLGRGAAAGAVAAPWIAPVDADAQGENAPSRGVRRRELGKTGLKVPEVGFGGHSWSYKRTPDGRGDYRRLTIEEATEMVAAGLDMGANFFDSCTPMIESEVPGEALRRLGRRDDAIVAVRVSHKMKGVPNDVREVYKWTEDRLRAWQTDYIDVLMLSNEVDVTEKSGYWDMSHCLEALDKLKQQGKIRFTGFGSHFEPKWFLRAFEEFGEYFDCCSMPYNVRHRVAEQVMPAAKKAGLGVITIKPFARGALLKNRELNGKEADLPRELLAFVLENESLDVCLCGVHTLEQMKHNFSASWTGISSDRRKALQTFANAPPLQGGGMDWLENGWC
ncbi:MAG: aldo/keto reductase [Planctomycetota bacterium]